MTKKRTSKRPIDEKQADKKCLDAYNEWLESQAAHAREVDLERKYGA